MLCRQSCWTRLFNVLLLLRNRLCRLMLVTRFCVAFRPRRLTASWLLAMGLTERNSGLLETCINLEAITGSKLMILTASAMPMSFCKALRSLKATSGKLGKFSSSRRNAAQKPLKKVLSTNVDGMAVGSIKGLLASEALALRCKIDNGRQMISVGDLAIALK